jgi:mycofactocin precursor
MPEHDEEVLSADELSTGELLVEEVSIDGMCGVY